MLKPELKATMQKYISSHNGQKLDQKKLLQPNEMVKKIMVARFMSMTPEQQQSLSAIIMPQTIDALNILLPGIVKMLERKSRNGN